MRERRRKGGQRAHSFDDDGTPVDLWFRWRWDAEGFAVQSFRNLVHEAQRSCSIFEDSARRIVRLLDLPLGQILGALGAAVMILASHGRELLPLTDLGCVG